MNYARRQEYRRLSRAAMTAIGSAAATLLALAVAEADAMPVAGLLLLIALALGACARHWLALAGRSRVGAQSECEVQRVLAALEREGWRMRHSLPWRGRGDIDSVAISPDGFAFVIETKTKTYDAGHLSLVREQAAWLRRHRGRWCRRGAVPVLCAARARGVRRYERGVPVVSIDLLTPALRSAANRSLFSAA